MSWTVESLKEYLEAQLAQLRRLSDERVAMLTQMNDDRDRLLVQIMDERQEATKAALTKAEESAQHRHDALVTRLDALTQLMAVDQGKAQGLTTGWGYLLGVIAALGTIVSIAVLFTK